MKHRFGRVFQRSGRKGYYVRFRKDGREVERFGGLTKAAATRKLALAHAMIADGATVEAVLSEVFGAFTGERLTFHDAVPHYLAFAEKRKKASTIKSDTQRLAYIRDCPWAKELLARIRPEQITRFVQSRRAAGVAPSTLNRDLSIISALFRWAIQLGYVDENPVRRVERFSEKGRGRRTYLTAEEARALIEAASLDFRPLLTCALHTGMRRGEILGLRWRAVDFEQDTLTVEPETEKAGRGRTIPLTPELSRVLRTLRSDQDLKRLDRADPVFVRAAGRAWTIHMVRNALDAALNGCEDLPEDKRVSVTFHTLRHTAASLMVGQGVPLFDVARILGHSTLAMTMRYAHFAPDAGRRAIDELARALGN